MKLYGFVGIHKELKSLDEQYARLGERLDDLAIRISKLESNVARLRGDRKNINSMFQDIQRDLQNVKDETKVLHRD